MTLTKPFVKLRPILPATRTKRDLLAIEDLSAAEVIDLLHLAEEIHAKPQEFRSSLEGRHAALLFEKPSLRTRVTFEVGMHEMGGEALYLAPADISLGKRETVKDIARNLARWVDALIVRTFSQNVLWEMAHEAHVPVINALSDLHHPCQALADVLTLRQLRGDLRGLKLAYLGDGNNVAHSLIQTAAKVGIHLVLATPPGFEPDHLIVNQSLADAGASGGKIEITYNPTDAIVDADAVYTDVWISMGQEEEAEGRRAIFRPFQVNARMMSMAKPDALFMHCLPAHRGEEVTDEVLDGHNSVVLEQAENRLYIAKAVLFALL
jgi:ornithine carbamoyltransferase